ATSGDHRRTAVRDEDVELVHGRVRTRQPLVVEGVVRVAHDREQPGAGVSPGEGMEVLERAQIRFLHHVLRLVLVARQPAREAVGGVEMRQGDLFEQGDSILFRQRAAISFDADLSRAATTAAAANALRPTTLGGEIGSPVPEGEPLYSRPRFREYARSR